MKHSTVLQVAGHFDRTAHQHDFAYVSDYRTVALHRLGNVGQRPQRENLHGRLRVSQAFHQVIGSAFVFGRT